MGLLPLIGFSAAALATTISGWTMVLQLWLGTRKMGDEARFDTRFRSRLPRILAACAIMGAALWAASIALGPAIGPCCYEVGDEVAAVAGLLMEKDSGIAVVVVRGVPWERTRGRGHDLIRPAVLDLFR